MALWLIAAGFVLALTAVLMVEAALTEISDAADYADSMEIDA